MNTQKKMKTTTKQPENMGGVIRLWAIPATDLQLNGRTATLVNDENTICLEITQDSGGAEVTPKSGFEGTTYLHQIGGFLPGYSSETEQIIAEMERKKKYVVIYLDSEGELVMLGRPEIPLRFSAGWSTGESSVSARGYRIALSGNVHYLPVRLSNNPFE